ncbi:MAG: transposase [Hyphomicrobium sp.]
MITEDCQVHLQRNAAAHMPKVDICEAIVVANLRSIFNAPSREEADRLLVKTMEKYSGKAGRLAVQLKEDTSPDGLTVFALPEKISDVCVRRTWSSDKTGRSSGVRACRDSSQTGSHCAGS